MATQLRGQGAEKRDKPGGPAKRDRTTPTLFVRQVIAELRKVIWPTRRELRTYTVVSLVFILVMVCDRDQPGLRVHQADIRGLRLSPLVARTARRRV